MVDVYRLVRRAASAGLPVLIVGETGTGKELVARALHSLGVNPDGPFVDINCAAIPETLAEAELFGWERGAFTGAIQRTIGVLEEANGGTLLLDEACSLPLAVQAKLLRAIELREYRRVGSRKRKATDFRLVATVMEPFEKLVASGRMRADFAYRISGLTINLPPLRERGADISLLADFFLERANKNGPHSKTLSESARALLASYRWPGNIRELKTLMERLNLLSDAETLTVANVRPHLFWEQRDPTGAELEEILQSHDWKVAKVARKLGMGRTKLYGLIERYGLERAASV